MASLEQSNQICSSPVAKRNWVKLSSANDTEKVASAVWGSPEGIMPYLSVPARWSVDWCQVMPAATRRTSRQPVPTASHIDGGRGGDGGGGEGDGEGGGGNGLGSGGGGGGGGDDGDGLGADGEGLGGGGGGDDVGGGESASLQIVTDSTHASVAWYISPVPREPIVTVERPSLLEVGDIVLLLTPLRNAADSPPWW